MSNLIFFDEWSKHIHALNQVRMTWLKEVFEKMPPEEKKLSIRQYLSQPILLREGLLNRPDRVTFCRPIMLELTWRQIGIEELLIIRRMRKWKRREFKKWGRIT